MIRQLFCAAFIALAPFAANALVIQNDLADLNLGDTPRIGDGYNISRENNTFTFTVDLSKNDLDLTLPKTDSAGDYLFFLTTSQSVRLDGIFEYLVGSPSAKPDTRQSAYAYDVTSEGSFATALVGNSGSDSFKGSIFNPGDFINIFLYFDGDKGVSGRLNTAATLAPVPLPAGMLLSLGALGGLGLMRLRRREQAA